jgi:hypothetical protein
MPTRHRPGTASMLDAVARAIADADGTDFDGDRDRFRRLARAALQPLARPTKGMINAAHAAVEFDAMWAINTNRDFARAVKAMIEAAVKEKDVALGQEGNPATEWHFSRGRR